MSEGFYGSVLFNETVSQTTATPSVELGCRRLYAGYEYVYFYNEGGASITKTYGFFLKTGITSGWSVTVTNTSGSNEWCVGVVRNATVPTANYFWGLVRGYSNIEASADNSLTAGEPFCPALDGTFVKVKSAITLDTTTVQSPQLLGRCITGTATDGSCVGYFNTGF